jgi:hypothetical protein
MDNVVVKAKRKRRKKRTVCAKTFWYKVILFIVAAFSENGQPSSARVLSTALSVWSMGLIAFMIRHAFYRPDPTTLKAWLSSMPVIIYSLAVFSVSPYGLAKLSGMFNGRNGNGRH